MTHPGLPPEIEWPPWMQRAASDIGVRELKGIAVHPRIAQYYDYTPLGDRDPNDDETAWCAAAMCCWMEEAGYKSPRTPRARDWIGWGEKLEKPRFGCILVLSRGNPASGKAHVTIYVEPALHGRLWVLGGNQLNSVRFSDDYEVAKALAYRWPSHLDKLTV